MGAPPSSDADPADAADGQPPGRVLVRFWASARSAAGVAEEYVEAPGPLTLAELVDRLGRDRPGLGRVLGVCSVLIGDRPAGSGDRSGVRVRPGEVVEFLPPFAGG